VLSRLLPPSTAEPSSLLTEPQGDVPPCARLALMSAQLVSSMQRLETCWRVHLRRGHTMETTCDRGDGPMAQKGRGIFLVYVDIDAQHEKEFNEW
jgi:hypothetical protein